MPIITIEGPKIDIEKKRKLSSGLAEAASAVYGLPIEKIIVLIRENPPVGKSSRKPDEKGRLVSRPLSISARCIRP